MKINQNNIKSIIKNTKKKLSKIKLSKGGVAINTETNEMIEYKS